MLRIEPALPMLRIDPALPTLRIAPALPPAPPARNPLDSMPPTTDRREQEYHRYHESRGYRKAGLQLQSSSRVGSTATAGHNARPQNERPIGHVQIALPVQRNNARFREGSRRRSVPLSHKLTGGRKLLDAVVGRVTNVDVALIVERQATGLAELPGLATSPSPPSDKF